MISDICHMSLITTNYLLIIKVVFLSLFLSPICFFAQTDLDISIPWGASKTISFNSEVVVMPDIQGQQPDNGRPVFYKVIPVLHGENTVEVVDFETVSAPELDIAYLNRFNFQPTAFLQLSSKITFEKHTPFAVLHLFPYVLDKGVVKRISGIKIRLTNQKKPSAVGKSFVAQSVLKDGTGSWYKIGVSKDGVYKIDKAFLVACGISTADLDPNAINIFGNGDGRLPELNSDARTDDLKKNAVQIVGGADGSFDDGDYLLFYGWGPSRWRASGTSEMDQDMNIYSDYSYYFLNVNPEETPSRVEDKASLNIIPNYSTQAYSYCEIHERDEVNLVGGGQRWYGELFDTDLEQIFTFSVPDIESTTPAYFKVAIATNSPVSSGTSQDYSVNGNLLSSSMLPLVSNDYARSLKNFSLSSPTATLPLKIKITRNSPSTVVYLDRILLNARRKLVFYGSQFNFRDLQSVAPGNSSSFTVQSFPSTGFVWDVTDRHRPYKQLGVSSGNSYSFIAATDTLREYVISDGINFLTPVRISAVANQNLHALPQADLIIVTHPDFMAQAQRLANLHEADGTSTHVVTAGQVFNEFSSGMQDPTAIRMFMKMFYDRSLSAPETAPKHLLLFGDGTYDPKGRVANNNNFILTYQMLGNSSTEDHISALVTDDYFAMLDDAESIEPTDMMDIGVGRILVSDVQMAKEQVDKIEHYLKNGSALFSTANTNCNCGSDSYSSTFGEWRTNYVEIADDEEGGYFVVQDTEPQYNYVKANHPEMNCDKLYCDSYTQMTTAGGERYPDVFNAVTDRVERGALVVNYVGHGGEVGLAEERIVTIPQIQSWGNIDRLNLFVSATCEFTKYDDPSRVSAGEWVSLNPSGGAIALMTTSRSVFFGVNTLTGLQFFENVFARDSNFEPLAFGEIMRITKNSSGSSDNKRSFTLIGDPALKIALPKMKVVTDSINGLDPGILTDTLRALSKVQVKGHLEDFNGNILNSFNGTVVPTIFDKPKVLSTLGQNMDSPEIEFELQKNIVYKGKATVTNGYFSCSFIVPKDINYSFGNGKISYYANSSDLDALGSDSRFIIGGVDTVAINDVLGPEINLSLNDKNFVSGGLTDETPVLIADLFDENGINTVGNGIGHDLTVILDGKTAEPTVLNDYYTADLDSYQSGQVKYTFPALEKGRHSLTLKVWDVNNNSSEKSIDFIVQEKQDLSLDHVLNYPNPFTTHTTFYFEHNQVCSQLEAQVLVYTVSGKLVRTINQVVNTVGFRSQGIEWDGKDDFGDQLAKGVYVYTLKVTSPEGQKSEKTEKLVLLR